MVSADNLNYDCLQLIFAHLSGHDLVSVSLVSRSFLTGVIPRLYRTLSFGVKQAKRYPSIDSPFAVVLAHPDLANHVRSIDLRAMPTVKFMPHPKFLDECTRSMALCNSLGSFTCTLDVMPKFLQALRDKKALEQLRFIPNLTIDQAKQLSTITGLRALTLDSGSWTVVDVLPKWCETLKPTLASLTLTSVQTLSRDIMEMVLPNLPNLTSLHILNCTKVDENAVLELIVHTPQLQSLALTSYSISETVPEVVSPLPFLRHLAIDAHHRKSTKEAAFHQIMLELSQSWSCRLSSFSLKLSEKTTLSHAFIKEFIKAHRETLVHLSFRNCALTQDSTMLMFRKCKALETLRMGVPVKEIAWFADALARSKRIHTLTDVGDSHGTTHVYRASIQKNEIRTLMAAQPKLEKIVADSRTWTVS
ncbi:hypothetical protein C8Q76DRAFT_637468 [Earliella scabrosa]|nr:hypothetical protein C8Q76DRAFT_637468 [Earliella scabrosa]